MRKYVCSPYEDPDCGYVPEEEPEEFDEDKTYDERRDKE